MKCKSGIRAGLLVLVGVGLSACAAGGTLQLPTAEPTAYPPTGYAHMVGSSHVALYWNCTRSEPGVLRLEGVAVNPWSMQPVRFLRLELAGVNERDQTVSEATVEASDLQIFTHQNAPFRLDLRTTGAEVRFDLYYRYRFQDNDVERKIAGAMAGGPFLLAQEQRFLARDVCSETQHRAR